VQLVPKALNESTISLYFTKVDGSTLKIDVPAPKANLTAQEVKTQMDAIVAVGGLFDINGIKDAGISQRSVSDFDVEGLVK
jgi:hypothetical protein